MKLYTQNGRWVGTQAEAKREFGEVFQITNTKRMKAGATPEEKINAARKDYFGAA